jgi:hypothetical protein
LGSALRGVLMSSCKAVIDMLVSRNCVHASPDIVRTPLHAMQPLKAAKMQPIFM